MIDNGTHVIVRTYSAGVFAGTLTGRKKDVVKLADARRLWRWGGAASLSQLATTGTSNPQGCKFPVAVDVIMLLGVIEIIPTTEIARASIDSVPVWIS